MCTYDGPLVDIFLRTSVVYRLDDFLLWPCHQETDIQIVETKWPESGLHDLFVINLLLQRARLVQRY